MQAPVRLPTDVRFYGPPWWHKHGNKMYVALSDNELRILTLRSSAAEVHIRRAVEVETTDPGWFVDWEVVQYKPYGEKVEGRRHFTDQELEAAFGLSNFRGSAIDLYKGLQVDSAVQGVYIRWRNSLNIPCPGTGHDGDPNVSIYLDDQIRQAVRQLMRS